MRRSRLTLTLLLLALVPGVSHARVIGHTEPAEPLSEARIRQLPAGQQGAWLTYLHASETQNKADRAQLAAERSRMSTLPPLPASSPSTRSIPVNRDAAWYGSAEALHIARVIVSFQTPAGGWGKNLDMSGPERVPGQSYVSNNENRFSAPGDLDQPRDPAWHYVGTLDNDATTTEMRFLSRVQAAHRDSSGDLFRQSFLRGLHYLLAAQFPNGGWPQVWPLEGGYHDALTFNDDAFENAAQMLDRVAGGAGELSFVPSAERRLAASARDLAVRCALQAQVVIAGRRTVWAQQQDALTLLPVGARNFEPAALASQESADLLVFLLGERGRAGVPDAQLLPALQDGAAWLRAHALNGLQVVGTRDTPGGRHVVHNAGAEPIWARYYSITTGQPVFGDRDKTVHDSMDELSLERRNGYAWYTAQPARALARIETNLRAVFPVSKGNFGAVTETVRFFLKHHLPIVVSS